MYFWDQIINGTKKNDKQISYKVRTTWACV
jgi:hypothetical protein